MLYEVTKDTTHEHTYYVEAENAEDALERVRNGEVAPYVSKTARHKWECVEKSLILMESESESESERMKTEILSSPTRLTRMVTGAPTWVERRVSVVSHDR